MTARTWVDGPAGGTPINAARLNGMETDITSAKNTSVNVADYGVIMDGSAPTGSQLTNAISAANLLGLPLRLPAGTYAFDQVNIPSNMIVEGVGPETVIVQSVANQPTFVARGTIATLGALTSDLAKGATVINVTQSWGLVAGDIIVVTDNFSYAATDSSYTSGEQFKVASSTSSAITLTSPVRGSFSNTAGSYTVANSATVRKITPAVNISIRNMAFKGNAAGTAQMLLCQYVDGLELTGLSTISAQAGFCMIETCRNVRASEFTLNGLVDNIATGYPGYGFIVRHACHNVRISNGISNMARHAITTMGGPYGAPRNLVFGPNIISSDTTSTAGIDTHSAGEGILIHGNTIENSGIGITCRARNVVVRGNTIRGTQSYGVTVTEEGRDILIDGNNLVGAQNVGINVGQGTTTHNNVEIRSNTMRDITGHGIKAITGMTDLRIIANTIIRTTGQGINVDAGCSGVTIAKNDVINASLSGNGPGINVTGTQAAGIFDIVNNVIKQDTTQMNRAIYTTRTQGRMVGNTAFGTYLSTGTEFNAGTGFTNSDNLLYA